MKLVIVDLDGTLFDTKDVNYHAYKEAIAPYGYDMDYKYYCEFCNGRYYLDFLPQITTGDDEILSAMHMAKKRSLQKAFGQGSIEYKTDRYHSFDAGEYKTAVVTTASKENCWDILKQFEITDLFDLVLTHDDIMNSKPNPEGFLKAMEYFEATPEETIIFEDSDVGLEAAEKSGAFYYRTYRFN